MMRHYYTCVKSALSRNSNNSNNLNRIALYIFAIICPLIELSGPGIAIAQTTGTRSLSLSTTTVSFGAVNIGQTATQSVVLKSTGTASVTISGVSVAGSLFGATGITTPLTLGPGQSATLTATFKPAVANPWNYSGIITISSNAASPSVAVNMSGQGVVTLKSVSCATSSMTGAGTDSCTVTLSGGAPSGGQTVTLASNNTVLTVPSTIILPAGATSANFTATVSAFSSPQTATITASSGGVSQSFALKLAGTPSLSLSTTTISFGSVSIGQTATQPVVLKSTGTAPVTISGISVAGSLFGSSGIVTPLTLNPGQSVTLIATFKPTVANPWSYTGTTTIASNSSTGNLALSMTGAGINPAALSSLTCTSGSITGVATDACTVSLTAAAPAGGMAVNLSSSSGSVTVPASVVIPSGATSAGFSASVAAVSTSQTATVTASAGSVTKTFSLQLTAATPTLTVSATNVDFGTVVVGKVVTQTLTLKSTGNGPVTISALSVAGSLFSMSGIATPLTLNPGRTAALTLSFTSAKGGPFTGVVTITSNSSSGPLSVNITAASSAGATLSANATSIPFGQVYVGQSSTQSVTLTASGGSVVISSASVSGNGFSASGLTFPLTLASGQSATLDVAFAPTASGSATGQLTIQSNSTNGTINLPLSGSGTNHAVKLNWVASTGSSVAGYNVYRKSSGGSSYTKLNSSVNQSTSFTDAVCQNGQAYQYYVTSVDGSGKESTPSNTINLTIPQ
jgi:hypothetical protein